MGNTITQIFDVISGDIAYPFFYGLVGLVAIVAAIAFVVNLIKGWTSPERPNQKGALTASAVVLVITLVIGFAPTIINWIIGLSGGVVGGVSV